MKKPLTVRTRTLDNVLSDHELGEIDIAKIDVEGAELLVLRGMRRTLSVSRDIKLLVDIHGRNHPQIFEYLTSDGFTVYNIAKELKPVKSISEMTNEIYATRSHPSD